MGWLAVRVVTQSRWLTVPHGGLLKVEVDVCILIAAGYIHPVGADGSRACANGFTPMTAVMR